MDILFYFFFIFFFGIGIFFWAANFQIFLGIPDIPDLFFFIYLFFVGGGGKQ